MIVNILLVVDDRVERDEGSSLRTGSTLKASSSRRLCAPAPSSRLYAENDHGAAGVANHSPYRLCTFGFETAAPCEGDQVARVASGELEDGGTSLPVREHEANVLDFRRIAEAPHAFEKLSRPRGPLVLRLVEVARAARGAATPSSP